MAPAKVRVTEQEPFDGGRNASIGPPCQRLCWTSLIACSTAAQVDAARVIHHLVLGM